MAEEQEESIYRQEALENLASMEQFDTRIRIISPKMWIFSSVLIGLLVVALLWGIFGSIPTRVNGQGILLSADGEIYNAVFSQEYGWISEMLVQPGDPVEKGAVVARLKSPALENKVETTQKHLDSLREEYKKLDDEAASDIEERRIKLTDKKILIEKIIADEKEKLKKVTELKNIQEMLLERGLQTKQVYIDTLSLYFQSRINIDLYSKEIKDLKFNEDNYVYAWEERLHNLEMKINDEAYRLNELKQQLASTLTITSPVDGVVTSVGKSVGDSIKNAETILNIASISNGLDATAFLKVKDGKLVRDNMDALVSPANVVKEEYGSILGRVMSVAMFPANRQAMMTIFHNDIIVDRFTKEDFPFMVKIHLNQDEKTFSGFQWTSSSGPEQQISQGTLVNVVITVKKQRPIALIIPAFKKLIGVS